MRRWPAVIIASAVAIGALLFILAPALARDPDGRYATSSHAEWFKSQHNSEGQWCCDESDGHRYDGAYGFNEDGSVTVSLDGKPHVLPKHMVLTGPNPTGHAVWWFSDAGGVHRDYCFAPGTLS